MDTVDGHGAIEHHWVVPVRGKIMKRLKSPTGFRLKLPTGFRQNHEKTQITDRIQVHRDPGDGAPSGGTCFVRRIRGTIMKSFKPPTGFRLTGDRGKGVNDGT